MSTTTTATTRRRASAVCRAEGHLLVVRLRDPSTGEEALYPPGGAIEAGEQPADAAVRETLEETGLIVSPLPLELVERYPFRWDGRDYDVTTHFVAVTLRSAFDPLEERVVTDAPYNLGAIWLPIGEALQAMAVHPPIARAVALVLDRLDQREGAPPPS